MTYNQKSKRQILAFTFLFSAAAHAQTSVDVKSEGRKPGSKVIYRQSGVPAFELVQKRGTEMVKVKEIPKLDIGEEKQIVSNGADLKLPPARDLKIQPIQAKVSPARIVIPPVMLSPVQPLKTIIAEASLEKIPIVQPLAIIQDPVVGTPEVGLKNLVEIKPDEYKMLQALIFLEYQKKFDLAMNLFVELMDVPEYRTQALFHYAQTAYGLGLYSEFRNKMIQVTKETKDLALKKLAVESLVKNVSALENSDMGQIDPLVESFDIDVTSNDKYLLKKAKYFSEKGDLGQLENALTFISTTSPLYPEASLLKAVFNYRQGQLDTAISDIETAWPLMENNKKDQVRNLSALTLARLYFQKGDYKTAYQNYLKIDKSSSSWLQAMVEQAWTQILAGDYEGAAGNMFSLHTDFFRKAYAPDTYIVRTVGYLNLCQFGDGVSVLNDLQKRYKSTQEKLEAYKKNNQDPMKYYDLVKNWLRDTKVEEIEGVPRAFIVELARHPHYTTIQKQINKYEEENSRFNKITIDLIRKEREARLKMLQTKNEFAVLKREKASIEKLRKKEQQFLAVGVEHMIISRAREGIKKMRTAAVARLEQEKDTLRLQVAKNLKSRYTDFVATLGNLVDQKEVLSYEIYSGAGEHIRYQMAGGQVKDRAPAALTPNEDESYKWKFKGEVWEDEIGHYRSSLKNVCPSDDIAHNEGSN
jgi:tetratricopeptide (TPR) repeat protein